MYCYVLSDTLCPKYHIALTPNHLPPQVNVYTVEPLNVDTLGTSLVPRFSLRAVRNDDLCGSKVIHNICMEGGRAWE